MPIILSGMPELLANLDRVGKNVKAARRKALLAGAEVIRDQVEKNARAHKSSDAEALAKKYSPGQHMADNIVISTPIVEDEEESADVGPTRGANDDFFYGKFIEFGAAAHDIEIKRGPYAGMTVHHPGITAQPFVEPALLEKRDEALEAMADVIREAIRNA
jgi:HK97 gp10 family phage protein